MAVTSHTYSPPRLRIFQVYATRTGSPGSSTDLSGAPKRVTIASTLPPRYACKSLLNFCQPRHPLRTRSEKPATKNRKQGSKIFVIDYLKSLHVTRVNPTPLAVCPFYLSSIPTEAEQDVAGDDRTD